MTTPYERGKEALDELMTWYEEHPGDRNEATTRLHLVDQLLTDVLAWPREEVVAEEPFGPEYVDYALGRPGTRMIVEAKREGAHFSVPVGLSSLIHRLPSLTDGREGAPTKAAAEQVAGYCARRGVAMAAITNGTQIVAFLGARTDGIPPLRGAALVFPSLSAMRENFRTFWDNLSRPGVEARTLHLTLREGERPATPEPLSAHLGKYPGYKQRNDIQTDLQVMAELFLEDITKEPTLTEDFLRETYASSGTLSQYAVISKKILKSRYSVLHEPDANISVEPAANKKGLSQKLQEDIVASGASRRPIVLLGDVGVGKTMFIRRLIHVDAKEIFDKAIVLYIDFGTKPTLLHELGSFIADEAERQLLANYDVDISERRFVEAIYNAELNRFDKGIYGELKDFDPTSYRRERLAHLARLVQNREVHLLTALTHIRSSWRKQVVIFLDNIDQRDYEFQERVFLMAEALAAEWPATVFVSLRPDTFYRSRKEGTLAAYQPRAFTIAPPRVEVVLKKRLRFAANQLRDTSRIEIFAGVTVSSESLNAYLEVLLSNFESNENLLALIDNLSAGNIRRALEFVSRFIGSGHVDTTKILNIYAREGRYFIPPHEFLRAIMYGDNDYYDPSASPVANLFDISQPDGREHFLLALLVAFTESLGDKASSDGFIPRDEVYSFAQKGGFSSDQVAFALDRGVKSGLIERSPRLATRGGRDHIRVTSAGAYTARVLAGMFTYLDAVVVDTPILDENYRRLITDVHSISERLRRAEVFRVYLDKQWNVLGQAFERHPFNWHEHSERVRTEVDNISRRIP
jgi:GTPase SAR1 family protein